MSLNNCVFSGRLGRDSETKYLPNGTAVLEFSLAVDSGWGDRKTSWWLNCAMFGERGEKLKQYLTKGAQIAVIGQFTPRPYTTKDGAEKISMDLRVAEVEMFGSKSDSGQSQQTQRATPPQTRPAASKQADAWADDDDIPFATCGHAADTIGRKLARRIGRAK
jgi:single-strand DNA-binding protein